MNRTVRETCLDCGARLIRGRHARGEQPPAGAHWADGRLSCNACYLRWRRRGSPAPAGLLAALRPPDWMESALCAQVGDPEAWFPYKGGSNAAVKAICGRCPVRAECLEYAMDAGELRDGIWGGLPPRQRQRLARRRAESGA